MLRSKSVIFIFSCFSKKKKKFLKKLNIFKVRTQGHLIHALYVPL